MLELGHRKVWEAFCKADFWSKFPVVRGPWKGVDGLAEPYIGDIGLPFVHKDLVQDKV